VGLVVDRKLIDPPIDLGVELCDRDSDLSFRANCRIGTLSRILREWTCRGETRGPSLSLETLKLP
jgi:hypothetical protein